MQASGAGDNGGRDSAPSRRAHTVPSAHDERARLLALAEWAGFPPIAVEGVRRLDDRADWAAFCDSAPADTIAEVRAWLERNSGDAYCSKCRARWRLTPTPGLSTCPACRRADGQARRAAPVLRAAHDAGYPEVVVGSWRLAGVVQWAMFIETASLNALAQADEALTLNGYVATEDNDW